MGTMEEENNVIASLIPSLKKETSDIISSDIKEALEKATVLENSKYYKEAYNIYKSILSITNDPLYVFESLNKILFIYRITKDKELLEYLKIYSKNETNPISNLVYASGLMVGRYIDEALSEYYKITKNYPNTYQKIHALAKQCYIHFFCKNDVKKSK